jgi:hypothetical protein
MKRRFDGGGGSWLPRWWTAQSIEFGCRAAAGHGRKKDLTIVARLQELVEPETAGDPMTGQIWVRSSLRSLTGLIGGGERHSHHWTTSACVCSSRSGVAAHGAGNFSLSLTTHRKAHASGSSGAHHWEGAGQTGHGHQERRTSDAGSTLRLTHTRCR